MENTDFGVTAMIPGIHTNNYKCFERVDRVLGECEAAWRGGRARRPCQISDLRSHGQTHPCEQHVTTLDTSTMTDFCTGVRQGNECDVGIGSTLGSWAPLEAYQV